ncbi:MAG: ribokinase [Cryobacterium sp.]|nr:ribokinase [Cryobacterium sp.]
MRIAVAGGYGVALTMRVTTAPSAGETVTGGILSQGHGGKGSNQAVGAARLGADVSLFTAVGDDANGAAAREFWALEGVDAASVVTTADATMVGFIIVDETGENRIAIAPGALAGLTPADAEGFRSAIADADLFVVSLEIPLAVALRLLAIAREEGTPTVLNPAPAEPLPDEAWATIDYLTPNSTEAATLLALDESVLTDAATAAERLSSRFDGTVVVTGGSTGAVVVHGGATTRVPALRVPEVVDTTGAGDAFTAAFSVAIARGQSAVEAARFASTAGAYAVTIAEVIPSLATHEQLENFQNTLHRAKDQK